MNEPENTCPEDGLPCHECGPSYCWASYPEHLTTHASPAATRPEDCE